MSTLSVIPTVRRSRFTGLEALLHSEVRLLLRSPALLIWVAILPITGSIVLGAIPAARTPLADVGGLSWFTMYQPVLIMFSTMLLSAQILPDVLTRYREQGILKRLRTTPASPAALLAAQVIITFVVEVVVMVIMVGVPTAFGAPLPHNLTGFLMAFVLSARCMMAIGMVLASAFRNAKVAGAVGTVLFFILQFFAGLWLPRATMPDWLRATSDITPTGASVGAITDAVNGGWPDLLHVGVLLGWTGVLAIAAIRLFRWE